ncbi:MAG: hypothetical protein K2X93_01880 [Candidatus Obscuribacterales bacterium]|nr:hypothetical protein [Candidatus Obscuribacterales bacterium]
MKLAVRISIILTVAFSSAYFHAFSNAHSSNAETLSNNQASRWTYRAVGDFYKLTSDDKVRFNQRPSTHLKATRLHQDAGKFYATPFQDVSVEHFRGKRVQYSAFLKAKNVEGDSGLWMKAKSRGAVVAFDDMAVRALKGSKGWTRYSLVFDVPTSADTLSIGFYLRGSGALWLAGPELKAVSNKVQAHSIAWDEKKYTQFASDLKSEPTNMDFTDSRADLSDWMVFTSKSPSKVGVDHAAVYQNKPSGFIEQTEKYPGDFVLFFQDISAAAYSGKRVSFSGMVKTREVTDWTALWMRVDSGKKVAAFDNMQERPIRGDTEWSPYSVVLEVPSDATRIRFGFMQSGSGKSWLNSPKLDVVGKVSSVSGTPAGTVEHGSQ